MAVDRLIRQISRSPESHNGHRSLRIIGTSPDGISPDAPEKPHLGNIVQRPAQKAHVMRMVLLLLA